VAQAYPRLREPLGPVRPQPVRELWPVPVHAGNLGVDAVWAKIDLAGEVAGVGRDVDVAGGQGARGVELQVREVMPVSLPTKPSTSIPPFEQPGPAG
jgi:hypothetical protein